VCPKWMVIEGKNLHCKWEMDEADWSEISVYNSGQIWKNNYSASTLPWRRHFLEQLLRVVNVVPAVGDLDDTLYGCWRSRWHTQVSGSCAAWEGHHGSFVSGSDGKSRLCSRLKSAPVAKARQLDVKLLLEDDSSSLCCLSSLTTRCQIITQRWL
jgi:hypothetical protein